MKILERLPRRVISPDCPTCTLGQILEQYFPGWSPEFQESILWNETGWPAFWRGDPEDSLRLQLAIAAQREIWGEFGYWDSEKCVEEMQAEEKAVRE